jgi:CBS domain-containing protein
MRQLSDIVLNQHPLTMPASTTVVAACQQMRERRVGSVLVVGDNGRLVGIFTGRDAVERVLAPGKSATTTRLVDVMTPDPKTMGPDKTAIEALRLMWDCGFRHVPVSGTKDRASFRAATAAAWSMIGSMKSEVVGACAGAVFFHPLRHGRHAPCRQ